MKDTFVKGYIAGTIGGVVMALLNLISFIFGYSQTRFVDIVSIVFLGFAPTNATEVVISQIIQLGHSAFMGIAFAYLVKKINSNYIAFKGMTYGVIVWF